MRISSFPSRTCRTRIGYVMNINFVCLNGTLAASNCSYLPNETKSDRRTEFIICGGDLDVDLDLKLDPFSNMDIIQKLADGLS